MTEYDSDRSRSRHRGAISRQKAEMPAIHQTAAATGDDDGKHGGMMAISWLLVRQCLI